VLHFPSPVRLAPANPDSRRGAYWELLTRPVVDPTVAPPNADLTRKSLFPFGSGLLTHALLNVLLSLNLLRLREIARFGVCRLGVFQPF
jgi:hypothetical protein